MPGSKVRLLALPLLLQLWVSSVYATTDSPLAADFSTRFLGSSTPGERIVNGDDVDIVDYPFQVSIEVLGYHKCGGAIITEIWIISARHCFRDRKKLSAYRVRAGATQRQYGGTLYDVIRIEDCPADPGPGGFDYDVSLLRLAKRVKFGQGVMAIPVTDTEPAFNRRLQVTGYGAIGQKARLSSRLLKADVMVWRRKDCDDFFRARDMAVITERMLCAGSRSQDACQGDSGGPITDSKSKLVGLVSFGLGCGRIGHPGVYTNLADGFIRGFIKNVTGV